MSESKETAIEKVLKLLSESDHSTQEIADKLKMPLGTVRSTLSLLRRLGLVEPTKGKRGVPYKLTQEGRDRLSSILASKRKTNIYLKKLNS